MSNRDNLLAVRWFLLNAGIAVLGWLAYQNGIVMEAWKGDSTWVTTAILSLFAYGWMMVAFRVFQCSLYLDKLKLSGNMEVAKLKLASRVRPFAFLAKCLPMLGFFGTVLGIKTAISGVAGADISDAASASIIMQSLTSGFMVALFTTATGIVGYFALSFNIELLKGGYERLLCKGG